MPNLNTGMSLTTVYMFEIIWLLPVATFSPSMHDISRTYKKSLKITKGYSESVYRRRTDNTMAKRKRTKNDLQIYI